jgi:hypothetical protein
MYIYIYIIIDKLLIEGDAKVARCLKGGEGKIQLILYSCLIPAVLYLLLSLPKAYL